MSPNPNTTTVIGAQTNAAASISSAQHVYLGPNTTVMNNYKDGLTTSLPLTTTNVLTSQVGLNINSKGGSSSLTINNAGDINTSGIISAAGSMTSGKALYVTGTAVSGYNFAVSDSGLTTIQDNLIIGTDADFIVNKTEGSLKMKGKADIGGALHVSGESAMDGTVNVGKGNVILGNTGTISAAGNVTIGGDKVVFSATSGDTELKGSLKVGAGLSVGSDLNVGSGKFVVTASSGDVSAMGALAVDKNVSIGGTHAVIHADTGAMDMAGSLNIGDGKIVLKSSDSSIFAKGPLAIGSSSSAPMFSVDASTGFAKTVFTEYKPSPSVSDTLTHMDDDNKLKAYDTSGNEITVDSGDFTSSTSSYLTTQKYVDQTVFNQTVRINAILGADNSVLKSFNNVYGIVKAIEGSTTAAEALTTTASNFNKINTSVSSLAGSAMNSVAINASPNVWADACAPLPIPKTITYYTLDGWYFKNLTASSKINWYFPAPPGLTMATLSNLYMNLTFFNSAMTNNDAPWISVFTAATGTNDYWLTAHAQIQYLYSSNAPFTTGKNYTVHIGDKAPLNNNNNTSVKHTTVRTLAKGSSTMADNYNPSYVSASDKIAFFAIQSSSSASLGRLEFILNSFCVEQNSLEGPKGTTQFLLSNSSVATNYMYNTLFQKNSDFSSVDLPGTAVNATQLAAYNAIYAPDPSPV